MGTSDANEVMRNPRTLDERFGIYVLDGDELDLIATTPTAEGIGTTLVTLREEGEWGMKQSIGILDTCPRGEEPEEDEDGVWIVNPYAARRMAIARTFAVPARRV